MGFDVRGQRQVNAPKREKKVCAGCTFCRIPLMERLRREENVLEVMRTAGIMEEGMKSERTLGIRTAEGARRMLLNALPCLEEHFLME